VNPASLSLSEALSISRGNAACWVDELPSMIVRVGVVVSIPRSVPRGAGVRVTVGTHLDIVWVGSKMMEFAATNERYGFREELAPLILYFESLSVPAQ